MQAASLWKHELLIDASLLGSGLGALILCGVLCMPLAMLFPASENQPGLRKGLLLDTGYWLLDSVFHRPMIFFLTFVLAGMLHVPDLFKTGSGPLYALRHLSLLWQFLFVALVIDLLQYWIHRALHHRLLWKFHAIHHSSRHLDWLSSARLHPVNTAIYSILPGVVVSLADLRPEALVLYGACISVLSPLNHSNIGWTYGPLRHVVGSPVYHRWHHSTDGKEGNNKNFAFFFPFIDILFGTFHMPVGRLPLETGTNDPVPDRFFAQLAYPFRRRPVPSTSAVTMKPARHANK